MVEHLEGAESEEDDYQMSESGVRVDEETAEEDQELGEPLERDQLVSATEESEDQIE